MLFSCPALINNYLSPFSCPEEIVERLDRALNHSDEMQTLRENARKTVVEKFDLESICLPQHVQLIEKLAAGNLLGREI